MPEPMVAIDPVSGTPQFGTCPRCGYLKYPVLPVSPCGHSDAVVVAPLEESGVVYSWTRVSIDPKSEGTLIAMVDFLGGGIRVTAPLVGATEVAIGSKASLREVADSSYYLVRD